MVSPVGVNGIAIDDLYQDFFRHENQFFIHSLLVLT